jgi:DNA-binding NtrC family response regulator
MAYVFDELPVPTDSPRQLNPHLHQRRYPDETPGVTVCSDSGSLKILVAIDSAFILLDVQDTLRDLGYSRVRGTCSAVQARTELRHQPCDVIILGLDSANSEFGLLLKELEELHVPTLLVAGGVHAAALPALRRMEMVRAPFDSTALANAIERVVQEVTRRPDGS